MAKEEERTKERREEEATHILEECRMVLPGIQALFGFQLIAFFNESFGKLALENRVLHLVATMLTAVAIVIVLAIAAYQRQAEPHEVSAFFIKLGSVLLTAGMFALGTGITLEFYLISMLALKGLVASILISFAVFLSFIAGWFVMPRLLPRTRLAKRAG